MSRARDFADLAGSADVGGITGRNLIINGAMQVAQRGTSETGVTGSEYANAPDRFKAQITTAGTWTLSQSSTAPDGFANSYKWDCTVADASLAAGDVIQFVHKVEAQNLQQLQYGASGAQAVTVSFYVRSNKTGTYILEIFQEDSFRSISKSYTIDSADTWERKTITIPGDSSGTINDDSGVGFDMLWYLAAGTNFTGGTLATDWATISSANRAVGQVNLADNTANEWYITGVQLEVGEQATPFEHRSFGDELARCQRYFQISRSGFAGDVTNNEYYRAFYQFKTEMRTSPTSALKTDVNTTGFDGNFFFESVSSAGGAVYRQANTTAAARLFTIDSTHDAEL
jgi:hypothetical protein